MALDSEFHRVSDLVLKHSKADHTAAVFFQNDSALTRYANNIIHQNVQEHNSNLIVQAIIGKRSGVASTNDLSEAAIRVAVERAAAAAHLLPENPDLSPLSIPQRLGTSQSYFIKTVETGPDQRASAVSIVCSESEEGKLVAAGTFSTGSYSVGYSNSNNNRGFYSTSLAEMTAVVQSPAGSGYADRLETDVSNIDAHAVAEEAIHRATVGSELLEVPPGKYEVVLEPYCVCDILDFFGYLSFGALAVQEERSFMAGAIGKQVMGSNITIWDDALDSRGVVTPFDLEGVPKRKVNLITDGIAKGYCYDLTTAAREGASSTGHGLPPGDSYWGPSPANMIMNTGSSSIEEMISHVERGLLVTRFWYTRPVHPLTVTITGVTRDGTFLIENGKIKGPVKNLRFTQSYLEALNNVVEIGNKSRIVRTMFAANHVPALRIKDWNFTGVTQF